MFNIPNYQFMLCNHIYFENQGVDILTENRETNFEFTNSGINAGIFGTFPLSPQTNKQDY